MGKPKRSMKGMKFSILLFAGFLIFISIKGNFVTDEFEKNILLEKFETETGSSYERKSQGKIRGGRIRVKGKNKKEPKRDVFEETAKQSRKDTGHLCGVPPVNVTKGHRGAQGAFIKLWPNGVVPFVYDSTFSASTDRQTFQKAVEYINTKIPCIKFIPRTTQSDYLRVRRDGTCGGNCFQGGYTDGLGVGAPRSLFISCTCLNPNNAGDISFMTHEIFHALGVVHTQLRPDRNSFITVNFNNIEPNGQSQYVQCNQCQTFGTSYDCKSIMHYRDSFFSIGGRPTMTARNPNTCDLRSGTIVMTASDVNLVNTMYKCSEGGGGGNGGGSSCPVTFGYYNCRAAYAGQVRSAFDCARLCQQSASCKAWDIFILGSGFQRCYLSREANCISPKAGYVAGTKCGKTCEGTVTGKVSRSSQRRYLNIVRLSKENCETFCSVTPECNSWTFFRGSCYLSAFGKDQLWNYNSNEVTSGYKCNNRENCNVQFGKYLCAGNQIGNQDTASVQDCADPCRQNSNCRGWTRNAKTKVCYLKSATSCSGSSSDWDMGLRCQ